MREDRPPAHTLDDLSWLDEIESTPAAAYDQLRQQETRDLDDEGRALAVPAPNAIEWVVGAEWCDAPSIYGYPGQYQVIRDFFELRCPICNEGGTRPGEPGFVLGKTRAYLEDEVLLRWSASYEEDVCPKCGVTRSELREDGLSQGYNQLHLVVGQRAGKSICAGQIGTYVEHRLITLGLNYKGGLHDYFQILKRDPVTITFLAATDAQSDETIWAKYTALRTESPWFQRFVPWVKAQEAAQVVPAGMKPWAYRETDKKIVNGYPGITLICDSRNSNAPGLRGRSRAAAFADEISHMNQTESKTSASEIYRALENSLVTARASVENNGTLPWSGLMASVTSPKTRSDKGWTLLQDADRVPSMYARHFPTWEFNPKVSRASLEPLFKKDPVGAERDFGANPPGAAYPLITDEAMFRARAVSDRAPTVDFEVYYYVDETGQQYRAARVRRAQMDKIPRYITVDAGLSFDQFAISVAHLEIHEDTATGDIRSVTVFDGICRIIPEHKIEVRFQSIVDIVKSLKAMFPITRVEFDRWQSTKCVQDIRDLGIFAEVVVRREADFHMFKMDSQEGKVALLPPRPDEFREESSTFLWTTSPQLLSAPAAAIYELCGLQKDPETQRVSNPNKGEERGVNSDDLAQTVVHVHRLCQNQGYTEKHGDTSKTAKRNRLEEGVKGWDRRGGVARPKYGKVASR